MNWERELWLEEYRAGEAIAEIARRHQISRKALYKWIRRFEEFGNEGLADISRAPHHHPSQVGDLWRERVRAARAQHPRWGPYKLYSLLQKRYEENPAPSPSTIGRLLHEMGLSRTRRPMPKAHGTGQLWDAQQPNEVWAVDFKGWCITGDNRRCEPLTITDLASRYVLCCQSLESIRTELVRPVMEGVFRQYGLPHRMRSDNGAPFSCNGSTGLTELSVWWIELGIECERIEPGRPYQNGCHERMHRTLKEETMQPPASTLRQQQKCFDAFRTEYNQVRPHEGIGLATPAEVYRSSARRYPDRIAKPEYNPAWKVQKVHNGGQVHWPGGRLFVSHALTDKHVGFEPVAEDLWRLWFHQQWLGMWEPKVRSLWKPWEWIEREHRLRTTL